MATEELSNPSSLPPYPQMIVEAIDGLKEAEGSNKSTISSYMESKYGELPATHADLLTHNLSAMKDNGELLFIKNNYLLPSADVPLKRGRGRPPKAKEPLPPASAETVLAPPRGRGRPKKDPNAPPAPKKVKTAVAAPPSVSKTGRPRGRPRKVQPQALQNGVEA